MISDVWLKACVPLSGPPALPGRRPCVLPASDATDRPDVTQQDRGIALIEMCPPAGQAQHMNSELQGTGMDSATAAVADIHQFRSSVTVDVQ